MIRRPPRSTLDRSSAASDVYKRQLLGSFEDIFASQLFVAGRLIVKADIEVSVEQLLTQLRSLSGLGRGQHVLGLCFAREQVVNLHHRYATVFLDGDE